MVVMNWIITRLNNISSWFYELYIECYYAGWPLEILANLFNDLAWLFSDLAWNFSDFFSWLLTETARIDDILDFDTIWSNILLRVPELPEIAGWFSSWWDQVADVIDSWWSSTSQDVQDLIDAAVSGLESLRAAWLDFWQNIWPAAQLLIDNLQTSWNDFWQYIYPDLVDFAWIGIWWDARIIEVQGLIDTAFTIRAPLWDGWPDWRDSVAEFFTDPIEWIWSRFTDWFLGAEV